jgi:hypothetical protein
MMPPPTAFKTEPNNSSPFSTSKLDERPGIEKLVGMESQLIGKRDDIVSGLHQEISRQRAG